jgi:hypothetical protein
MDPSMTRLPASLLLLAATACAPAIAPGTAPASRTGGPTSAAITAGDLRHRLEIIAHDSMEGREVGTPGIARAERYIVAELERIGLRPAGDDGGWYHRVDLVRARFDVSGEHTGPAGITRLGTAEVVPVNGLGGLPETTRTHVQGPLRFGGWQIDPTVTGADELPRDLLAGSVLVLRLGAPQGAAPGTSPRFDIQRLASPGSSLAALILVAEGPIAEFWSYAQGLALRGVVSRPEEGAPSGTADGPLVLIASAAAVERLIGGPLDGARPLSEAGTLRLEVTRSREAVDGHNVVAVLPGRDPARAGEFVAIGSHHDHDGIGVPVDGDSIFNGADDNGSGTVAMLEIAEQLAALPERERPARSILFVWHTAEEKGLLGSEAFTDRPTVPREAIVAQLNADMIGRNHPDTLLVVGSRRLATELGEIVEAVNGRQPRPFVIDYSWDRPGHPQRIYCRSDHYSYARFGIPIAFFFTGLHDDYHTVFDTADRIEYDKLARVTRLISGVALEVANRPGRPVVDQPVPPMGVCS